MPEWDFPEDTTPIGIGTITTLDGKPKGALKKKIPFGFQSPTKEEDEKVRRDRKPRNTKRDSRSNASSSSKSRSKKVAAPKRGSTGR